MALIAVLITSIACLLATTKLSVSVDREGVRIRLFPLRRKFLPAASIAAAEAIRYNPLLDAGGRGLRVSAHGIVYSMSGRDAVKLTLADGSSLLIGTKHPAKLLEAIDHIRSLQSTE